MKTKRVFFLVFFGLNLLLVLSIHSCELVGCYKCERTNSQGKIEKTTTCDDDEAQTLRNQGWDCKGGW